MKSPYPITYHQGVSSSKKKRNEYGPVCNTKNLEIQIKYVDLAMVQHIPNSRKQKCMIKHTLNTFLQYEQ